MDLILDRESISNWEDARYFYDVWVAAKHGDNLPSWNDLKLPQVVRLLPRLMFMEMGYKKGEDKNEPYVRYVGSEISSLMPFDTTGKQVREGHNGEEYLGRLKSAMELRYCYQMTSHPAAFAAKEHKLYDAIVVPVSRNRRPKADGVITALRWVGTDKQPDKTSLIAGEKAHHTA